MRPSSPSCLGGCSAQCAHQSSVCLQIGSDGVSLLRHLLLTLHSTHHHANPQTSTYHISPTASSPVAPSGATFLPHRVLCSCAFAQAITGRACVHVSIHSGVSRCHRQFLCVLHQQVKAPPGRQWPRRTHRNLGDRQVSHHLHTCISKSTLQILERSLPVQQESPC